MFFKPNPLKAKRKIAEDWLQLAHKIYHYRRDLLHETRIAELKAAVAALEQKITKKSTATLTEIDDAISQLEAVLRQCGGQFYPRKFLTENVEMILVAAILALGIRAYFVQPFKIPTNSMYPTYHGMTHVIHQDTDKELDPLQKIFRFATLGSITKTIKAEDDGKLMFPIQPQLVNGRKYLIFPTKLLQYTFIIGNRPVTTTVPVDFSNEMNEILMEKFGEDKGNWTKRMVEGIGPCIVTSKVYRKGDTVLSFEILSGDALFVDRISYHFIRPQVGDPLVFPTDRVPGLKDKGKYYIKRIVGMGGDTLEVKPPVLYNNGKPIEGAEAFEFNANQVGEYEGYITGDKIGGVHLRAGEKFTVPAHEIFAMGDNSDQSSDSRVWGTVPEKEVIGRAIFIYYPFTNRWGISK